MVKKSTFKFVDLNSQNLIVEILCVSLFCGE